MLKRIVRLASGIIVVLAALGAGLLSAPSAKADELADVKVVSVTITGVPADYSPPFPYPPIAPDVPLDVLG